MIIKMMKKGDLVDGNPSKSFTLIPVKAGSIVDFYRVMDDLPEVRIEEPEGEVMIFRPEGNTYIMENGSTTAMFAYKL